MKTIKTVLIINYLMLAFLLANIIFLITLDEKLNQYSELIEKFGVAAILIFLVGFLVSIVLKNIFWFKVNSNSKLLKLNWVLFTFPPINLILPNILFYLYFIKTNKKSLLMATLISDLLLLFLLIVILINIYDISNNAIDIIAFVFGIVSYLIVAFLIKNINFITDSFEEINQIGQNQ